MNNEEIKLYGQKIIEIKHEECVFYDPDGKCRLMALWLHRYNRKYCDKHHDIVNDINKKRIVESNKIIKENIIKYIDNCVENFKIIEENSENINLAITTALLEFKKYLINGDFDD